MNFEDYLISKNIDSPAFKKEEPARWQEWADLFEQVSPASFTSQKLYLINAVRRRFVLKQRPPAEKKEEPILPAEAPAPRPVSKPVFKPKMK